MVDSPKHRPSTVPVAHIWTEVAAQPFASPTSFNHATTSLDANLDAADSCALWRRCEQQLAPIAGFSVDQLIALRDSIWFHASVDLESQTAARPTPSNPQPLGQVLRGIASALLEPRPGQTIPKNSDSNSCDQRWRWMAFALPQDLLVAAVSGPEGRPSATLDVAGGSPLMARRLADAGYAEVHVHLGGAMNFPLLWVSAMRALALDSVESTSLASPGAEFSEGREFAPWLLRAAIARVVLAGYLSRPGHSTAQDFATYVDSFGAFGLNCHEAWEVQQVLYDLLHPTSASPADWHKLQAIYRRLTGFSAQLPRPDATRGRPGDVGSAHVDYDPVAAYLGADARATAEIRLVAAALRHLERPGDPDFAGLFWQVVRLRCMYYRHVVQRPMVAGLQWFTRFYGRIGPLREPIKHLLVAAALANDGAQLGLRSFEMRTSPEQGWEKQGGAIRDFLCQWSRFLAASDERLPSGPLREFGVVLHIAKSRDAGKKGTWKDGTPKAGWRGTAADPSANKQSHRYAKFYKEKWPEVQAVCGLLSRVPEVLWVLRGIDMCTDEQAVPTWVMVPLYRALREAGDRAAAGFAAGGPPPLRATAHVGEDYDHLLSGLRRVSEAMDYLADRRGDRLGHAMALGQDPVGWAHCHAHISVAAEERLWDLVWAREMLAEPDGRLAIGGDLLAYLEDKIRLLAAHIFGNNARIDPAEIRATYRVLHTGLSEFAYDWPALEQAPERTTDRRFGFPCGHRRPTGGTAREALVTAYLWDADVFERGRQLVPVENNELEIALMCRLQDRLQKHAQLRGIVVEVNPTSNLLIGRLSGDRSHPLLRMSSPDPAEPSRVAIAVGSDDPLTFATCLPKEYEVLFDQAIAMGVTEHDARRWIERIRRTGMDARFTLEWPTGRPTRCFTEQIVRQIDDICGKRRS